jgi:hypothetical protein
VVPQTWKRFAFMRTVTPVAAANMQVNGFIVKRNFTVVPHDSANMVVFVNTAVSTVTDSVPDGKYFALRSLCFLYGSLLLGCVWLFISMGWDCVSELQPPTDLFISHVRNEYGEPRWNDTDKGQPKNSENTLSQSHSVHHKSHMDWPGCELGLPRWEADD